MVEDPFSGFRVLAFDLETTGLDTRRARIVQYALVGSDSQGDIISVNKIIDPTCKIPTEASSVHGIYDEDVKGKKVFSEHAEVIYELLIVVLVYLLLNCIRKLSLKGNDLI